MTKSCNRNQTGLALACALALSILAGAASAQDAPRDRAYLDDTRDQVVKSGFGLCWHTGFGPPPSPAQCEPARIAAVAYVAPPTPVLTSTPVAAPAYTPPPAAVAPEAPPQLYVPPARPARKDRN